MRSTYCSLVKIYNISSFEYDVKDTNNNSQVIFTKSKHSSRQFQSHCSKVFFLTPRRFDLRFLGAVANKVACVNPLHHDAPLLLQSVIRKTMLLPELVSWH